MLFFCWIFNHFVTVWYETDNLWSSWLETTWIFDVALWSFIVFCCYFATFCCSNYMAQHIIKASLPCFSIFVLFCTLYLFFCGFLLLRCDVSCCFVDFSWCFTACCYWLVAACCCIVVFCCVVALCCFLHFVGHFGSLKKASHFFLKVNLVYEKN